MRFVHFLKRANQRSFAVVQGLRIPQLAVGAVLVMAGFAIFYYGLNLMTSTSWDKVVGASGIAFMIAGFLLIGACAEQARRSVFGHHHRPY